MNTSALTAAHLSQKSLPVIDIGDLKSPDLSTRRKVADKLRSACADKGFFYISHHGIADELIAEVMAQAESLFALPAERKAQLDKSRSRANRGYEPMKGQTLETGTPPDLKEGFYIGPELDADDPRVVAGKFNHGPNQWPSGLPGFRPVMERYFEAMVTLSQSLMRSLALSLDLPEDHFDDFNQDPFATLRLLHYPPQPSGAEPNQKGAGAHTDFGGLTLLKQDDVGGLQVLDQACGEWIYAPPLPGTYVVNLGDMIARWTNDRYRSTLHRVVNSSGRERYSIPFFYSGNPDHLVECIPGCLAAGESPKYPPTTVEAHLRDMYRKTYG